MPFFHTLLYVKHFTKQGHLEHIVLTASVSRLTQDKSRSEENIPEYFISTLVPFPNSISPHIATAQ